MNLINQRFLKELFIEKKVLINSKIYNEIFDYIWKCEDFFIGFLSHSDPSIKLDYAKKIYSFLQAYNDIFLPLSMVNNIIEFQNSNLVDNIEGYIPQDHIVHCVNLYITGIYIFFNNELFNNKLIRGIDCTHKPIKRYKEFIDKWLLFSFYHDIGYYLEGCINKNGIYDDKYKNKINYYENEFINDIVYLCTTRIITRLITIVSVTQKRKEIFCYKDFEKFDFISYPEEPLKLLKEYDGAILINDFHNYENDCVLNHIFKYTQSMTICYDNNHKPICIIIRKEGKPEQFLFNSNYKRMFNLESQKIEEWIDIVKKLPCNHYVLDLNAIFHQYGNSLFENLSTDFFEKLPKELKEEFVLMSSSRKISSFYNHINDWIISKLKTEYLTNDVEYIHDDLFSFCYKNVFPSELSKTVNKIFENYKNDRFSSEQIRDYINNVVKKINIESLENDIRTAANKEYEILHGAFIDICDFGIIAYNELNDFLFNSKQNNGNIKSLQVIKSNSHNKVTFNPFAHNKKNCGSLETEIYKRMIKISSEMRINFFDLQNYHTSYTLCDHGVVSAAFLFQGISIFSYISKGCNENKKINLLWNTLDDKNFNNNETNIEKYSDVIFSILLHNIYTKESAPYGVSYKHNIDINPFSYFCAYCDTIQKWNRPKQIDLSKTFLPETNYLSDLFDIELKNGKIYLKCFYSDLSQLNCIISNSEDFLPGISRFTKVLGMDD